MRRAFFHEDNYCQIELQPLENLEFYRRQAGEIDAFSEQHKTAFGWDSIYVRNEPPTPLESLGITVQEVRSAMSGVLVEYDEVETGTYSDASTCSNVFAFGNDSSASIFVGISQSGVVDAIWCSYVPREITRIPRQERLLLVHWSWGFICPLQNAEQLRDYFAECERHSKEVMDRMEAYRKTQQGH